MPASPDDRSDDVQRRIYETKEAAERYDELVRHEDADGNLTRALSAAASLDGARVLDVGTGTGRVAAKLLAAGARVVGVDRAEAMLAVARERLAAFGDRVELFCADARSLPVGLVAFDLAVAGWAFGHFRLWMPTDWREHVAKALGEMERAVRPGGTLVVIETLGTGVEAAAPPSADLAEYYDWLERVHGFARTTIQTDYAFDDVERAASVLGFFFGPEKAARIRARGWARVPEFTGVWSKTTVRQ